MRPARLLLAPFAALALAACGGGDATEVAGDATVATTSDASPSSAAPTPGTGTSDAADGRPAAGTCADLPEAADGRYAVAAAGTVTLTREGDRLVLGEVVPNQGWEAESIEEEDDEIEVEFRQGDDEVDFEAEIDDGRLDVEVCADDD